MTSVKGLACRERLLLPRCVIYVIIIIIYLAQEGHLLEAGGGHAEGSRGGLDPPTSPLHVPTHSEAQSLLNEVLEFAFLISFPKFPGGLVVRISAL